MKNIIICGYMGSGKSLTAREILIGLSGIPANIYDINNEYSQAGTERKFQTAYNKKDVYGMKKLTEYRKLIDFDKMTFLINFQEFQSRVVKVKRNVNLYEEATIAFSNRGREEETINILSRRRHIDSSEPGTGNVNILIFHSLLSIPNNIISLIDDFYLFKTGDNPKDVEKKFKGFNDIYKHYLEVREKSRENKHYRAYFHNNI